MGQSIQQIYEANSSRKYPFIDTHTEDIADDIVLDMSLSVPVGVTPVVTVISVTTSYFFMAIEDTTSGDAVGHCMVNRPTIGRIYDIETTLDDSFGWLILGPGRNTPYENRKLELELDPTVILTQPTLTNYFDNLTVDGFEYDDLEGNLKLTADNPYIRITLETRDIDGVGEKQCLVFSRDDAEVPVDTIYQGFVEGGETTDNLPATRIGGVQPDDDYNVNITSNDIDITTIQSVDDSNNLGLLFKAILSACEENDPRRFFTHSRCDEGLQNELPLDSVVEEFNPDYADPECGCDDDNSSSESI